MDEDVTQLRAENAALRKHLLLLREVIDAHLSDAFLSVGRATRPEATDHVNLRLASEHIAAARLALKTPVDAKELSR